MLVVRHVLGCGGSGFRLTFSERSPDPDLIVEDAGGIRVAMDRYSHDRLDGAAIDYDTEKEMEGFVLDHPDAAIVMLAAFC